MTVMIALDRCSRYGQKSWVTRWLDILPVGSYVSTNW